MLLHRLFLLVMLIGLSWSDPDTNCEEDNMACFAPGPCIESSKPEDALKLVYLDKTTKMGSSCESIVKIRSYTKKHYLIRMESYDSDVTQIKLEQGPTKFECKNEGGKVLAMYMDEQQTMIKQNISPLSCEFYVKKNPVFDDQSRRGPLKLSSSKSDKIYTFKGDDFHGKCSETCDPEGVEAGRAIGEFGGTTYSEVDSKLANLVCPAGNKLMVQEGGKFVEAASIICEYNDATFKYGYRPKLASSSSDPHDFMTPPVKAYCEMTICKLCDANMAPTPSSGPSLEVKEEGGCNVLKCTKGRMKIDLKDPAEGSAKCENDNNKAVWKLNGETIKKYSTVICVEKVDCTQAEAQMLCPECSFDITNQIPSCLSNKKLQVEGENFEVEVTCNNDNGKFKTIAKGKGPFLPPPGRKLVCVLAEAATDSSQTSSASTGLEALPLVFAALAVIGLIVGGVVGYRFYMKKKQRKPAASTDLKTGKDSKSVESKSKESKSVNSSKKQSESKKDESLAPTPAPTPDLPAGPRIAPIELSEGAQKRMKEREEMDTEQLNKIDKCGLPSKKKKEDTVRRNAKKKKKEERVKEQQIVMNDMIAAAQKEKEDLLKGKNLDATQQSGGQSQSEGKEDEKDKVTAVIPDTTGATGISGASM